MGDKDKNLSAKKYLDVIKPYLRDIMENGDFIQATQ